MRILLLGATGQFGKRLSPRLANLDNVELILAGRSLAKLEELTQFIGKANVSAFALDTNATHFSNTLSGLKLDLVIHLAGPFQGQSYAIAQSCLKNHIHYIDMADGREFVESFSSLDQQAKDANISMITGASTVPGLTSALLNHFSTSYKIKKADYGISAGLKTGLGLATLEAVLGYCGKPFSTLFEKKQITTYGLAEPRSYSFPSPVNRRWVVNCDIPDFSLFPKLYPSLETLRFGSCIAAPMLPFLLAGMSWIVKNGWLKNWDFLIPFINPFMNILKLLGDKNSGFYMGIDGLDKQGLSAQISFEMIAHDGSGLEIPVTPVMLLVKKLMTGKLQQGAYPCCGLFTLNEFKNELSIYPIFFYEKRQSNEKQPT